MRRTSSAIKGLFFAPALVCLFFLLKAFCPASAGSSCFADQFAVPIFLPLVAVYKIFGDSSVLLGQEFLFIILYWAFIGYLIGLIVDLLTHREVHQDVSQTAEKPVNQVQAAQHTPIFKPIAPHAQVPGKKLPINLLDPQYDQEKPY